MTDKSICGNESLNFAKQLVEHIEQGNEGSALDTLERLSEIRESLLFQELGKLTRDLHNTLNSFQLDSKLSSMTETDIPDAKERLNHVISMTQEAADKTLGAVETSLPVAEELQQRASELSERWVRFRKRDMDVDEFRNLSKEIDAFFSWLDEMSPLINNNLSEILMAQGFQDLTGQIIRRVITLVQEVEDSFVDLIRITGQKKTAPSVEEKFEDEAKDIAATGPVVPGVDDKVSDVVSGQDDVDELLSSLGF